MWKAIIKSIDKSDNGTGNVTVNFCNDIMTVCKIYNVHKSNCTHNSFCETVISDLKSFIQGEERNSIDYEELLKVITPCLHLELTVNSNPVFPEVPPEIPANPEVPDRKPK